MTLMKKVLIGLATAASTSTLVHAADLPMAKADAVEYMKICTEFGAGFFYIPGSDTCLKLSGYVRADYRFGYGSTLTHSVTRLSDAASFRGRARVE